MNVVTICAYFSTERSFDNTPHEVIKKSEEGKDKNKATLFKEVLRL